MKVVGFFRTQSLLSEPLIFCCDYRFLPEPVARCAGAGDHDKHPAVREGPGVGRQSARQVRPRLGHHGPLTHPRQRQVRRFNNLT